jgi:hypothetical protein
LPALSGRNSIMENLLSGWYRAVSKGAVDDPGYGASAVPG